jgi:hypothetical protein
MSAPLELLLLTLARLIKSVGVAVELYVREQKKLGTTSRL